jgi:recombination associated protein RdgC
MFRNLRLYTVKEAWPSTEAELSERLAQREFMPCSAYSDRSAGWEPPVETQNGLLCRRVGNADLLQLRTQTRLLPPAAVNEALADRVAEFRQRTGDEPTPGERRKLKEETRDELLPKALVRSQRTRGCFLVDESTLAIDAASPSQAEWFIDQLRPCFGRFECFPLEFATSPGELIRRIFMGERVDGFELGRECRLQDPRDRSAVGAWRNIDLDDDSMRRHVVDGMRLTHLGVSFQHNTSAVLAQDGVVSKLKIIIDEEAEEAWGEDPIARLDADFALLAGTVQRLLAALQQQLGVKGSR